MLQRTLAVPEAWPAVAHERLDGVGHGVYQLEAVVVRVGNQHAAVHHRHGQGVLQLGRRTLTPAAAATDRPVTRRPVSASP